MFADSPSSFLRLGLVLLPVAVGLVALWRLLPQGRRRDALLAPLAAAGAALIVGWLVLTRSSLVWELDLLFYIFAAIAIISGICTITQTNPVYAALWFALVVLSSCGLFLLQSAPFLAAATIIVYAGAIIVTFLFVIMLAQQSGLAVYDRHAREPGLACLGGFVLLASLLYVLEANTSTAEASAVKAKRRDLQQAVEVLQLAAKSLKDGQTIDQVGRSLYLRSDDPDSAVGNVLYSQTDTLSATERTQPRAVLAQLIGQLGNARMAEDRKLMGETLLELARFGQGLEVRLYGTSLSQTGGDHVQSLGRSLFADYLWAVELAGTLLLVAMVGAIAIAYRGKEGPA